MKSIKAPKARRLPSGSWMCRVTAHGVSRCFTGPVKSEVEKIALEYKMSGASRNPSSAKVGDIVQEYIRNRSSVLSPSTIRGYEQIKRCYFLKLQNIPMKMLSASDCQRAINTEAKLHSPKTVSNAWGLFASAIRSACGESYNIRLPQKIDCETAWLDPDQLQIFLAAVKDQPCELGALLALHSLRRSEILDLTRDDIEITDGRVRVHVKGAAVLDPSGNLIHKATNKNASSARVVDIWLPRLALLLQDLPEGYLITCNPNTLGEQINRICERSGLPKVGVHGLRRSFASLAYHQGLSERVTAGIGGWADLSTMHKHYVKIAERDKDQAIDALRQFATSL